MPNNSLPTTSVHLGQPFEKDSHPGQEYKASLRNTGLLGIKLLYLQYGSREGTCVAALNTGEPCQTSENALLNATLRDAEQGIFELTGSLLCKNCQVSCPFSVKKINPEFRTFDFSSQTWPLPA